jgi:hypothetical protein
MDQKVGHQIYVDIFDRDSDWSFAKARTGIAQQQAESVAITRDGMVACFHLDAQSVGEEALDQRGQGH